MHCGWHQLAYERELSRGLNLCWIGAHPFAVVRSGDSTRAFDARCPHRGANLCMGGRLDRASIICPFHGFRIGLGEGDQSLHVREYLVLCLGGLVFLRDPRGEDCGFEAYFRRLESCHYIVPGFSMDILTNAELVIENAFDVQHFQPVHGIINEPEFDQLDENDGSFAVAGQFQLPRSPWHKEVLTGSTVMVPFQARAFSPTLVVSELGGHNPYCMITPAVPLESGCRVHLSLAIKPGAAGTPPAQDDLRYLLRQATGGLEKDRVIWENLPAEPWLNAQTSDRWILGFREFCQRFFDA